MAVAHLGTLGFLAMVMVGALYQMVPVVAGAPVKAIRLAYVVHALLLAGVVAFVIGLFGMGGALIDPDGAITAIKIGVHCLMTGLVLFIIPVGVALIRAPIQDPTVRGMRLALLGLIIATYMGFQLSRGHFAGMFPDSRPLWLQVHYNIGLQVWLGALIVAVSWQVVPMFYLTPTVSNRSKLMQLALVVVGLVALCVTAAVEPTARYWVMLAAAPGAAVVWLIQPLQMLLLLQKRSRPRPDGSLLFWRSGLVLGILLLPLGLIAHLRQDGNLQVLWGWLAIWGWAGLIVHGMLTRIVPFLIWFHRMSPHVGLRPVPSMRGLLSQKRIKLGWQLHMAALIMGSVTLLTPPHVAHMDVVHSNPIFGWLGILTGALLIATGVVLMSSLLHVLRQQPPPAPAEAAS